MRRSTLPALLLLAAMLAPLTRADPSPDWNALRRPLHLLPVARGQPCPLSRRAPEITARRYGTDGAMGPGPVYPILPSRSILALVRPDTWGRRWAGEKVFWLVRPDYSGPVLIRGRRLDGWQWMRFDDGKRPPAEIRIRPGETVKWTRQARGSRGRPSYVRVRAPGCYGVQIDGTSFSAVVVFLVDIAR